MNEFRKKSFEERDKILEEIILFLNKEGFTVERKSSYEIEFTADDKRWFGIQFSCKTEGYSPEKFKEAQRKKAQKINDELTFMSSGWFV